MAHVIAVFFDKQSREIGDFVAYRADDRAHADKVVMQIKGGQLPELVTWIERIGQVMGAAFHHYNVIDLNA